MFRLPAASDKQYEIVFETEGNGEAKPPLKPYPLTVTVEREVTEKPVKKRRSRATAVSVAGVQETAPVVKTVRESHEEWYFDVPLTHMSGIVLRVANGDKNKIFL